MIARITDMHDKEVISVRDGTKLGYVDDVEVDTCTAQIVSIVVYGRSKWFGLFGRESDRVIHWKDIEVIGAETVLVNLDCPSCSEKPAHHGPAVFGGLFR